MHLCGPRLALPAEPALRRRLLLRLGKLFSSRQPRTISSSLCPSLLPTTGLCWWLRKKQTEKFSWRRYDLAEPSEATELAQLRMGTFMDPDFQMPEQANFELQEQGSLACGFFVLAWIEQELRLQRGDWLRTWVQFSIKHWKEPDFECFRQSRQRLLSL